MNAPASAPPAATGSNPFGDRIPGWLPFVFGILLPAITLTVELSTGMNAQVFFDPVPSVFHILLVAAVPAANLLVWLKLRNSRGTRTSMLVFINGAAVGISLFYTILFLPILPIAAVAVIYFGLGLFPLTPLLSLLAGLHLRSWLKHSDSQQPLRSWPGVVAALAVLLALEIPATVTHIGMRMAASPASETRADGLQLLRLASSEDLLLRLCYVRSGSSGGVLSLLFNLHDPVSPDQARKIFYQVTGKAFNSLPPPVRLRSGRMGFFDADFDQGETTVGGRLRGLSLAASRMDGSLDANAALGYLEWTMVVRNDSEWQREARAQIALPPGAVVSRLTLWINGEEREAAFAGRSEVRQAYQRVVQRRRDPVVVTSAGKDRISVQMFPVPPEGEMKVRIGVTFPLALTNIDEGVVALPHFHERNFEVDSQLRHALWLESKTPLQSKIATVERTADAFALRANLEDSQLASAQAPILAERSSTTAWTVDRRIAGDLIVQRITRANATPPRRLVIVIDGSAGMEIAVPQIADILANLPPQIETRLIVAADEVIENAAGSALTRLIKRLDYEGGQDNTAALARGLDLAVQAEGGALLWIHGPQPVLVETEEALLQRLQRWRELPAWYDLQVSPGSNLIGEKLEGLAPIATLDAHALQRLISDWRANTGPFVLHRKRVKTTDAGVLVETEQTSEHLARLWAADQIAALIDLRDPQRRAEAVALAQQYQLVTPVSGAVVLETQQQYDESGLVPVDPGTVPTIPEPEIWALIAVVLFILTWAWSRQRQRITRHA